MIDESRPVRVLHIGSPEGLYGAERWILALVNTLSPVRVESVVAVLNDRADGEASDLCTVAAERGFDTVEFPCSGGLGFDAIPKIRAYIREHNIDLLHTHFYKSDIIGALSVMGTNCRIVTTPHGWSTAAGVKLQVYEWADRLFFYLMDAVAPLSPELERDTLVLPFLSRKVFPINNGVDLSEVDEVTVSRDSAGRSSDEPIIIGYIGQLITRKGVDTLIRAMRHLDSGPYELWVIGEGPQGDELQALASELEVAEQVRFFGYRSDRIDLLKKMDLFVLPSTLEGIPRCLMEAMAAGLPCIATDIPGSRDIVIDNETGLLISVGDDAALSECIQRFAERPELASRLGARASEFVRANYSSERMSREYEDLYARLVFHRGRRNGDD